MTQNKPLIITNEWLIGFFEAEGSFSWGCQVDKSSLDHPKRYYPSVAIAQKETTILFDIRNYLGYGHVSTSGQTAHMWQCRGYNQCRIFAKLAEPLLRTPMKLKQFKRWNYLFDIYNKTFHHKLSEEEFRKKLEEYNLKNK